MCPIFDNDGTTDTRISELYDNDGTSDTALVFAYDNDGTTDTEVYSRTISLSDKSVSLTLEWHPSDVDPGSGWWYTTDNSPYTSVTEGSYGTSANVIFDWSNEMDPETVGERIKRLTYDIRLRMERFNDHTVAKFEKTRGPFSLISEKEDPYGEYQQGTSIIGIPVDSDIYWARSVKPAPTTDPPNILRYYYPCSDDSSNMTNHTIYSVSAFPFPSPAFYINSVNYICKLYRVNEDTAPEAFQRANPPTDGSQISRSMDSFTGYDDSVTPIVKPKATFDIYIYNVKAYMD